MYCDFYCLGFVFDALFSDPLREKGRLAAVSHGTLSVWTTTRPPKEKAIWLSNALRLAAGPLLVPFIIFALAVNTVSADSPNTSSVCNGFCPRSAAALPVNPIPREYLPSDSPWNHFVVRVSNAHPNGLSGYTDLGSGVIIQNSSGQKFVLTAAHIFRDGTGNVSVRANSGFFSRAEPVLLDRLWDIALLKIDPPPTHGIPFAAAVPAPGDETLIAGFGSDNRLAATRGHVIGYAQSNRTGTRETLKTTGAVRQGDSGGPVLNRRGELIGVVWGTDGQNSYATYSGRIQQRLAENPALLFKPVLPLPSPTNPTNPAMNHPWNHPAESAPADNVLQETLPAENHPAIQGNDNTSQNAPSTSPERMARDDLDSNSEQPTPNTQAPVSVHTPQRSEFTGDPAEIILGWALKFLLPALGVTVPSTLLTAYALWKIAHRLRKRFHRRKKNRGPRQTSETQAANAQSAIHNKLEKVAQAAAHTIVNSHNDYALELNDLYNLNGRNSVADATLGRLYDSELTEYESSSNPQLAQFASDVRRKIKKELCRIHSESPVPVSGGET